MRAPTLDLEVLHTTQIANVRKEEKMIVRLVKIETDRTENIRGRIIERRYKYVIELWRWFKRPVYLRMIGDWVYAMNDDDTPIHVELTYSTLTATAFREVAMDYCSVEKAKEIIKLIKRNPDRFVLD